MAGKFGFSKWSWKRATGLSAFKGKVSRKIGVPLTKSGREKKFGRWGANFIWPLALLPKPERGRRTVERHGMATHGECPFGPPPIVEAEIVGPIGRLGRIWAFVCAGMLVIAFTGSVFVAVATWKHVWAVSLLFWGAAAWAGVNFIRQAIRVVS